MKYLVYVLIILGLIWLNLCSGSTGWTAVSPLGLIKGNLSGLEEQIIIGLRVPAILTALSVGAALAIAGLLMQVLFENPLAGPGVMGVSSGAGLFAAMALLMGIGQGIGLTAMAILGSMTVLAIIIGASLRISSNTALLILGLMIGYLASAMVSVFQYAADASSLQHFVYWTLGSYQATSWQGLSVLLPVIGAALLTVMLLSKQLDLLLLGEQQMSSLGVPVTRLRILLLIITGLIVGTVTAYCGPLAFIGLAAPHIARMLTVSDRHRYMLPTTGAVGAIIGLTSLYLVNAPWIGFQVPLNAVLSVFGAPVVIWLLLKKNHLSISQ